MRMAGLPLAFGAAVLAGCSSPAAVMPTGNGALRVTDAAAPLGFYEGARAKALADAQCGPRGVRSSIYDRYEDGAWVFVEGCA
jgi:hypothetical protein